MDMTSQDPNTGPTSPQKGKGIEADVKTWRANWWDFYPLLEHQKPPLQWSQSSVVFSAHAAQPIVTGRYFSSSKQFMLPSPTPIASSPASYNPPSVISVSPDNVWLLAYFYRRDGDGIACLWKRGHQIDNWQVKDFWPCQKGCSIVTASWLEMGREWMTSPSGVPTRLPFRGPKIPIADMTMLIITQDNCFHVTYLRQYTNTLKTLKRSLNFSHGVTKDNQAQQDFEEPSNHVRQCLDAAIGLCYNDSSILIASHSRRIPSAPPVSTPHSQPFNPMDLSAGEDPMNITSADPKANDWEDWGEERVIEIFECQIRFDGNTLTLAMQQLNNLECPALSLTSLAWACTTSLKNPTEKGRQGLIAVFVNFHDYTKPPTSTLNFYGVYQKNMNATNRISVLNLTSTRTIETGVVTYIEPFTDVTGFMTFACILNHSGSHNTGKYKLQETPVGVVHVLNIPTFTESVNWIPVTMKTSLDKIGGDLPLFATISPNRKLLCTLSYSLTQPRTLIHALPTPASAEQTVPRLSMTLANAILTRKSTADIIYCICSPPLSIDDAASVLLNTLTVLDKFNNNELPSRFIGDIMGTASEIYRSKAASTKVETEIEMLNDRWKTAHEICSMIACTIAFEDSKEGDGYDLDVVWQLIAFSTWAIEFTEKLMKACILASNANVDSSEESPSDPDLLGQPIMLHLCHPFALQSFLAALNHVKAFREFLAALPAGSNNAQIAQAVLVDTVDYSGVNFANLISLLQDSMEPVQKLEVSECRKALATCHPTNLMKTRLAQLLDKISQSETLLNKSTLFIKPFDLIDGMARLSVVSHHHRNEERDVISKLSLPKLGSKDLCLRCGGKTVIDRTTATPGRRVHTKWHLYELMWQLRCICGGSWVSLPAI